MSNEHFQKRLKAWGLPSVSAFLVYEGHHGDSYFSLSDMERIKKAGELLDKEVCEDLPDDLTKEIEKEESEYASISETLNILAANHGNEGMIKKGQEELDGVKKYLKYLEKEQGKYDMYKVAKEQGGEYITIFLLEYDCVTLEHFSNVKGEV